MRQVKSLRACVCGSWRTLLFFTLPGGMSPEEQEDYERRVHDENKGKSNRRKTSELNNEILRTLERLRSLIGEANDQIKGCAL